MERKIIVTNDGSHTMAVPEADITYRSHHGARQESIHVFLEAGLSYWLAQHPQSNEVSLFEMGFGTGLNALLAALEAEQRQVRIQYTTVEADPLSAEEAAALNYGALPGANAILFDRLHLAPWNVATRVSEFFTLHKLHSSLQNLGDAITDRFDIIYYDAFAPSAQPELWTQEVFVYMYGLLKPGGLLVTYCSKSSVRRAMVAAGFRVTKPQGPWGKREMVRALKT
jgi:tRNA U34 5-methylaminomethyl-2-thiouridine-forming methyltransferase MnmC